jgi:hypothetical protein
MPSILNYTTKVEVAQTVAEIIGLLARLKAKQSFITNDANGVPMALEFVIDTDGGERSFKLPARWESVHKILLRDHERGQLRHGGKPSPEQAKRVAWRILKDWVEAQIALIEVGMVKPEEVWMPYMLVAHGVTAFEQYESSLKALPDGGR